MDGDIERKTREDVEKLKLDWNSDPCWDIYDTEGFEDYRDELMAFQREREAEWEQKRQEEHDKLARSGARILSKLLI